MDSRKIIKTFGFGKAVRVCDAATNNVKDVVRFDRHDGTRGRLELRASAFRDYRELENQLRDADAILPDDKEDLRKLLEALAKVQPRRRKTLLARAGWPKNFQGFAVGDRVLGQAPDGAMSPSRRREKDDVSGRLYVSGTAADWRHNVSRLARFSSLLTFVMSIPFAAPLLRPLGQSSFAIFLSGRTRVGKSVASLAAASAQGLRQKGEMLTWSITAARLEELLPEWNDLMVPIDDFMTMEGSEAQRLSHVEELAYRIASGRERDRHSSFKSAARAGEWRTILLTQSEYSVAEMSRRRHQQRLGGAALRLIDLPALDCYQTDIFDLRAERLKASPTPEWRAKFFERLINCCRRYHGAAGDAYISALIAARGCGTHPAGSRMQVKCKSAKVSPCRGAVGKDPFAAARADQKAFVADVIDPLDGDEARDLATKFGIVFAGACRAIEYGIVAWTRQQAFDAARTCYKRARALLADDALLLRDGLDQLRKALIGLPVIRQTKRELPKGAAGFREHDDDFRRCIIRVEALAQHFSSRRQQQLVLEWCADNNRLTLAKVKDERGGFSPKEQFIWPNGQRRRSYEFLIPVSARI